MVVRSKFCDTHHHIRRNVSLHFIQAPEDMQFVVLRDIVRVQNILPVSPFKPRHLINAPLQLAENASWQAERSKCR